MHFCFMCLDLTLSTPLPGTPIQSTSRSPTTCNRAVPSPAPANDCILVDEQEDECTPRSKRTRKEKLSLTELQLLTAANSMMAKATQPKLEPSEDLLASQLHVHWEGLSLVQRPFARSKFSSFSWKLSLARYN